jgi:hypothetical protein
MTDEERHLLDLVAASLVDVAKILQKNTAAWRREVARLHGIDSDTVREAEHDIATLSRAWQDLEEAFFPSGQGTPSDEGGTP